MNKAELRKKYKQMRAALSAGERSRLEDLILIQFQRLDIEIPSVIMTYAPIEKFNEFDPQLITDYCFFKNARRVLLYPVIEPPATEMISTVVHEDTLFEINSFGIAQPTELEPMPPEEIELVLVPLLAYDSHGNRVGYGKGYYDRFLKGCTSALKIGFSFFEPEAEITGINEQDVQLDYCICPDGIHRFYQYK